MGNIPLVTAREGARTPIRDVRGAMASADDFGASIGRATQQLGGSLGEAATALNNYAKEEEKRKRTEAVANAVATDKAALDEIGLTVQRDAPADGGGKATVDKSFSDMQSKIDADANAKFPDDPQARQLYKTNMLQSAGEWNRKQTQWTFQQSETNARVNASTGLDATINRTRTDPSTYDENLADADKLIDANTSIPAANKQAMKIEFRNKLGEARFSALMTSAKSVDDFDNIQKELTSEKFSKTMNPATFDRTMDAIKTSKNQFMTQEGAKANAALTSMEARSKDQTLIPDEELSEMAALAKNSKSPAVIMRYQNVYQQQQDLRAYGKGTPDQLRAKEKQLRQDNVAAVGPVAGYVNTAASIAGVQPSIIQSIFGNEYDAKAAAAGDVNRPNAAGASSARGLFQMIDSTFISTVRQNPGLFGDQTGRTDAQVLAMRDNPENQAKAMGAFTKVNAQTLQANGVALTAPNLYMMHFLGNKGGMTFLRAMAQNPNADARSVVDFSAVSANGSVFYKNNGEARTVGEVYDMFAAKMLRNQGISGAQYNRAEYIGNMATAKEKAIKTDPITQAQADAVIPVTPLTDPNSYALRGQQATAAASYYSIPTTEMKPFTAEEASNLSRKLKEGSTDDKLAILAQVQAMDKAAPGMATAALKQLGEEDTTVGHAAGLYYSGRTEDAAKVMRGSDRIANDKTLGEALGRRGDAEREFNSEIGLGLNAVKPEQRMAIFNAAKGHYIENNPAVNGVFNPSAFRKSVRAVMGGQDAVTTINGSPTVVPQGVSPERFERAIEGAFNDQDYAAMSVDGNGPKYGDGTAVSARDIAYEGTLRWVGAGTYAIAMSDGKLLVTGKRDSNGNMTTYRFTPTKENVEAAIARQNAPSPLAAAQDAIPPNTPLPAAPPNYPPSDGRPRLTDRPDRWNMQQ